MSAVKKVQIDPRVKVDTSSVFIRRVSKKAKSKFYTVAKSKNLQPRELFEQLVEKAL